jgi:hypothetical protein
MSKKKILPIAVLLAVLVVLLAAYLLLTAPQADEEEESALTIATVSVSDAVGLSWTNDDEEISLVLDDGVWKWAEDDSFPVDQSKVDTLLAAVSSLTPDSVIDSADVISADEYGLDDPVRTVTVTAADGSALTYRIGGASPLSSSSLYTALDGTDDVYLLPSSFSGTFAVALDDLLEMETIPTFTDVTEMTVTTDERTIVLTRTESVSDESDDSSEETGDSSEETGESSADETTLIWTASVDGAPAEVDQSDADALLKTITSLSWTSCLDYNADDESLESVGLITPAATVTIRYTATDGSDATFSLALGDTAGSYAAAKLADSRMVYLVDMAVKEAVTEFEPLA